MLKTTGTILAAASIALVAGTTGAAAQDHYDHYDHQDRYHHYDHRDQYRRDRHWRERHYGQDCRNSNATAGTIAGAVIGGIIGNQFGHGGGKAASTVGGVVLGGLAGNAIAKNISCDNRPYAYHAYYRGFKGPVGHRYDWRHHHAHGYIRPIRQYRWHGHVCRDFVEVNWHHGHRYRHRGTACRIHGEWRMR